MSDVDPSARLLRLLSLLQSRPQWAAAELAARLEVDRRTVRRDVARLRDLGYPVDSTPGVAGYRLGVGGRLPPLLLDDDEAVAIAVGLRLAATAAIAGIEETSVAALAKLDQVLPPQVRERVRALHGATASADTWRPDPSDPETLAVLARGCREHVRVGFTYRAFGDRLSARRVEPAQIVSAGRRWYLVGMDLDRGDWRTFRVDRVTDAVLTGHRFEPAESPIDAAARVRDAFEQRPAPLVGEVAVRLAPADARRRLGADVTDVRPADDDHGSLVTIEGRDVDHLARIVLAMAVDADVEVVGPVELRERVRAVASSLAR